MTWVAVLTGLALLYSRVTRSRTATLMYYGGDLAEILLALTLLVTWRPEAARVRRAAVRT